MRFSFKRHTQTSQIDTKLQVCVLALAFLFVGCKQETLEPLSKAMTGVYNYGKVDARFCSSTPSPAQQKLKYLFIVDHSASNKPGVTEDPTDVQNTDANGGRRFGPMVDFVNNLAPDPNTLTSFGLISFNDNATQPTGLNGFESNVTTFNQIARTAWLGTGTAVAPSPRDRGFTNYHAALSLAEQIILRDAQGEAAIQNGNIVTSVYQIVFVSDGIPTVQAPGGAALYTQQFTTDLKPVVDNILNLKNSTTLGPYIANISINTAYYYNANTAPTAEAVTLLQQMANAGDGLFIQFGGGQNILYQQFAPPSRNVLNQLADVLVENVNGLWWDDGQFMLDTDGDGFPDYQETELASNPSVRDSDGNGVSDLVEFRTKGKPCDEATCSAVGRDPYAICAGYSPAMDAAGNITFASSSNDGLNDCEKFLMNGNAQSFNTNGNLIPDLFAVKNTLPIQKGSANVALEDTFSDGMSNYSKLKLGYPIQVSSKQLVDFEPRSSSLTVESVTATTTCYRLTVDNIALSSNTNKIKVYVVQNSSTIQNKPFLMTAEKSLDSQLSATFQVEDFK